MKNTFIYFVVLLFCSIKFCISQNAFYNKSEMLEIAKVWGFLKYYHPKTQQEKINWDDSLQKAIMHLEQGSDLEKVINNLINPLGKVKNLNRPNKYLPKDTTYNNLPFRWLNSSCKLTIQQKQNLLHTVENYKPKKIPKKNRTDFISLKELKRNTFNFENDTLNKYQSLVLFIEYWNKIDYFYPYKNWDFVQNWDSVFIENIHLFNASIPINEFKKNLVLVHNKIRDNHGFNNCNWILRKKYFYPFKIKIVDSTAYLAWIPTVYKEKYKFYEGEVIKSINAKNIQLLIDSLKLYHYGTHALVLDNHIERYLTYSDKDSLQIVLLDSNNKEIKVTIKHNELDLKNAKREYSLMMQTQEKPYYLINENMGYINNFYCNKIKLHKAFKKFKDKPIIIFDQKIQGQGVSAKVTGWHISNKRADFAVFYSPNKKFPGTMKKKTQNTYPVGFGIQYLIKKYKGQLVILIDENNSSGSEFSLLRYKALDPNIILIGRNTAGAISTAGSIKISDCVMWFSKKIILDEKNQCLQYYGVKPDIYIPKTFKKFEISEIEKYIKK